MVIGEGAGGTRLDQAFSRIEAMFKEASSINAAHDKRLDKLEITAIAKEDLSRLRSEMYEHVSKLLKENTEQVISKYDDRLVNARQAILADVDKLGVELHKAVSDGIKEAFAEFVNDRIPAIVAKEIATLEEARREERNKSVMRWRNRILLATAFVGLAYTTWDSIKARNETERLKSAYDVTRQIEKAGRAIQP